MNSDKKIDLEVIATSIDDVEQINKSSASCIELCGGMDFEGLTPESKIIMPAVELSKLPVRVMVRPRPGNFVYSDEEFLQILASIHYIRCCGAEGIVIGMLTPNGDVDGRMIEVIKAAGTMRVTFHRAFEEVASPIAAYDDLVKLGVDSILMSSNLIASALPASSIKLRFGGGLTKQSIAQLYGEGSKFFHVGRAARQKLTYQRGVEVSLIDNIVNI